MKVDEADADEFGHQLASAKAGGHGVFFDYLRDRDLHHDEEANGHAMLHGGPVAYHKHAESGKVVASPVAPSRLFLTTRPGNNTSHTHTHYAGPGGTHSVVDYNPHHGPGRGAGFGPAGMAIDVAHDGGIEGLHQRMRTRADAGHTRLAKAPELPEELDQPLLEAKHLHRHATFADALEATGLHHNQRTLDIMRAPYANPTYHKHAETGKVVATEPTLRWWQGLEPVSDDTPAAEASNATLAANARDHHFSGPGGTFYVKRAEGTAAPAWSVHGPVSREGQAYGHYLTTPSGMSVFHYDQQKAHDHAKALADGGHVRLAKARKDSLVHSWTVEDAGAVPSYAANVKKLLAEGKASVQTVPVGEVDNDYRPSEKIDKYAKKLGRGEKFPLAIGVRNREGKIKVPDGNHRVAAWKSLGHSHIPMLMLHWDKLDPETYAHISPSYTQQFTGDLHAAAY